MLALTAAFMLVLVGAAAMTVDVGSWFREKRQAQLAADAAALSGAQLLPGSTAQASATAQQYVGNNGATLDGSNGIQFRNDFASNDTIVVTVDRPTFGFLSSVFGIVPTQARARAAARSDVPVSIFGAAPIAVNKLHPMLSGPGCPCFNTETTIPLDPNGAPGSFALVNLDQSSNGTTGASTLANWVQSGFQQYLDVGSYLSDPGVKWNNSSIQSAMQVQQGSVLLFPVYDTLTGSGQNAQYHVIGWAAFHVDGMTANGTSGSISGYFVSVIWKGIQSSSGPNQPDFGVHTVSLVN